MKRLFLHNLTSNLIKYRMSSKKSKKSNKTEVSQLNTSSPPDLDAISIHKNGDFTLKIAAKPNSKESSIVGNSPDGIEIKIGAPAVDGEANSELISFLSKVLECRKSDLSLDRGSKNRSKIVTISKDSGLNVEKIRMLINEKMEK